MLRTCVGYAGGTTRSPTYEDLGDHTETLQVEFDPTVIGYERLLAVFWAAHTPTAAPWSTQYKAAVFTHGPEQARLARATREAAAARLGAPVRTEVLPFTGFTPAEDYHQKYALRHRPDLMRHLARAYGQGAALDAALIRSTAAARLNGWIGSKGDLAALERELPEVGLPPALAEQLLRDLRGRAGPVGCR